MTEQEHWLRGYIEEKEKSDDEKIKAWARILKKHYDACVEAGFDEWQSIHLVEVFWKQVDKRQWLKDGLIKDA